MAEEKEMSEREKLAMKYYEENGEVEPESSAKAETAPEEAETKTGEKPEDKQVEEEKKEPPKEEKKEQKEEEKFVPLAALQEERRLRQANAEARRAAEARSKALEDELARMKTSPESESISDYDKEIIDTKRRLQAIENKEKERIEREKYENAERIKRQIRENIAQADKDLESEGYPGFSSMTGRVTDELQRLVDEDPDNAALDNPSGWKKIFKEKIFPEVSAKFEETFKKRSIEDKIALKREAGLVDSSGKKAHQKKEQEDLSEDEYRKEYIAMRNRLS